MKSMLVFLFINIQLLLVAQTDSTKLIKYSAGFRFKDGIYITHTQLLNNNPISVKHIISQYNKNDFDFFSKLLAEKKIAYFDTYGIRKEIDVDKIWGFCRMGSVYINWGDDFNRIPVIGNISHFVATVTTYEDRYYSPTYGYATYNMPRTTTRTEIYQFMLDFNSGKVLEYSVENLSVLFMNDQEIYDAYNQLSKKKQKQLKFKYLREYNEKHPLFIPVE